MRQIVLDTETTGLKPQDGHRIIEIGCVELVKRRFTGNNFHFYINPEREIDAGALKVHGLSTAFLANKPRFVEIYQKFIDYIGSAELIIHNAPFDLGFLNHEFLLLSKKNKKLQNFCQITDTLAMARKMHSGQRNSLDALCKRYSIDNSDRELHGALLDAKILANVYLAMTGGQSSLFDADLNPDKQQSNTANEHKLGAKENLPKQQWDLPVIDASAVEQKAHTEYLDKMQKKTADKVIWD